jgi:hypothetical protein
MQLLPILAPIALFIISFGLVSLISKRSEWRFLKIVGLTILTARIVSYLAIYFIGNTPVWTSIYSDNWNHFQLGLLLILVAILLRKLKKGTFIRMAGVGLGLVLDEITDVFKLFGYPFTDHFRDSFNDLLLIVTVFLIVVLIAKLVKLKK